MVKKIEITKFDIARWIAVLPVTFLGITLFSNLFIGMLYQVLPKVTNVDTADNILGSLNAFLLPLIIISCGYWISPKYKFKSTLILALSFITIQSLNLMYNEYARSNPFIPVFALSYLLGLFVVYRFGKK
jgi:hypothetical protein